MTVLLGLLSAFCVGTSDFVGGQGSRRAPAMAVTAASQMAGFAISAAVAVLISSQPVAADFAWGAVGGVAGAAGLLSIYAGYARARVAIAAPIAGVGAAAIPALFDVFTDGDALSALTVVGVVVGLAAIAMTSMGASEADATVRASMLYGLGGAVGLGLLLTGLSQAGEDSGLWPLVAARGAGSVALLAVLLVTGSTVVAARPALWFVLGIGVLNTAGNAAFIAATRIGSTTVAAVVTSLFPAVTVLWAWKVFGERLRPVQVAGIGLALLAVGLIAAG